MDTPEQHNLPSIDLPPELKQVFYNTGPGCVPVEADLGVVHVCHAADRDIVGFTGKPVWNQWQLALLPTAPVIRLRTHILDHPNNSYKYESFLNVGDPDQARILDILGQQDRLYLAFYGDNLAYRFTKVLAHDQTQREQLQRLTGQARQEWQWIPADQRDFDQAKLLVQQQLPL